MRLQRLLPVAGLCLLGAGCQIPTDPPIIDQRWILPLGEVTLGQDELVPTTVTVVGSSYDVSVDPVNASESFGNLCGTGCNGLNGLNAPTPPYQESFQVQDALPDDVLSVEVTGPADGAEIVLQGTCAGFLRRLDDDAEVMLERAVGCGGRHARHYNLPDAEAVLRLDLGSRLLADRLLWRHGDNLVFAPFS